MKKDFILPDIGEGIVECEIVEWLVQEGEQIKEDQPVCDVMTDKALVQIPAVHDGIVTKLYYQKGDIAKVHQPLFEMDIHDHVSEPAVVTTEVTADAVSPASGGYITEDFILPDIGEGIVECEIVEWLVQEGEQIKEDQPVCDVMTDKALVQIPAKHSGTITKLYYQKGDIAKVHQPLFEMSIAANTTSVSPVIDDRKMHPQAVINTATKRSGTTTTKAVASPAVRRLARELDVDLTRVAGSGDKGRVYKADVVAFAEGKNTQPQSCPRVSEPGSTVADKTEAIKGIKAAMARQMTESVSTIPHFTYCEEIDLTALIALRGRLKDHYAEQGIRLTMMPFFIKALSMAIKQFPVINSRVNDDCTLLTYLSEHNIGVAVDSKVGLLVPNIKGCQSKSVLDIATELTRITEQARDGRVSPADLKGGTVTISNIGALGGTVATPIINKPEVAIVALGKVQSLPRFDSQGQVVARQLMQVSWSGDHRVIDGGTMARFCNLWKQYLEEPATMLVSLS